MDPRRHAPPPRHPPRRRLPPRLALPALAALAPAAAGCGGAGDGGAAAAVPARAGEVWEADRAEDRANAAATLLAFVNGVHVVVVDGDDAYAGMTRLRAARAPDGHRTLALANGLSAQLVPVGDVMELRFSSGEALPLRRQPER